MIHIKTFWNVTDNFVNNWIRQHNIDVVDIKINMVSYSDSNENHVITVLYKTIGNEIINLNGLNK